MKGIIFNLLEEVVSTQFGEDAWDAILESAGVEGAFTSLGNYPDDEFARLISALSERTGKNCREALKWFGHLAMPYLSHRYPELFSPYDGTRSFLLSLNDVIHAEVRKLYPGAEVPNFEFETQTGAATHDTLIIHYHSKRQLCQLAEGFIAGAADHYRERVVVMQPSCMLDGAAACRFECRFEKRA